MTRPRTVLTLIVIAASFAGPLSADWADGVAAYQAGRFQEATTAFLEFVDRSPDAPEGHFMLGRSLYGQKRFGEAAAALTRATKLGPANPSYSLQLAQVQLVAGQAKDAMATISQLEPKAIPDPMRASFNGLLANVATANGHSKESYSALEKALAVDPKSMPLLVALDKAAHRHHEPEKRFDAMSRAYEIDPRASNLGLVAVHVAITIAQDDDVDTDRKHEWYRNAARVGRKLVAAFPTVENLKLIGGAEMGAQQYEGAVEMFEIALAKGGGDLRLHYDLGRSYIPLGRHDDALKHLQTALEKSPGQALAAGIHASRALAYRHLEEFDRAAEAYRLADDNTRATEMANYAKNRREWEAAKAECLEKRVKIAELRKDSDDLKDTAEWQELDRDFTAVLTACEPYFREHDDPDHG